MRGLNNPKIKKAVFAILLVMAFFCITFLFANSVHAQTTTNTITAGIDIVEKPLGLPTTDIRTIVARIIRYALGLLGIVLIVIIMYGGFLWMTAGGNEEQIGKAKAVLRNAVIGLALILLAYSIVIFVMRMLGVGFGPGGFGNGNSAPGYQRFSGSGALGRTIKDHYPRRNQKDVSRNTKIIITLNKPILLDKKYVTENSGDAFLGNCKSNMKSWEKDCDNLQLNDKFINITNTKSGKSIKTAAILASTSTINKKTGIYTLVLRPITSAPNGGYLGDDKEKISYTVRLGEKIRFDDKVNNNPSAFKTSLEDHYKWSFITDTKFDKTPPVVKSVYPSNKSITVKNTVIQIDFNEAMDPTGIQGEFKIGSNAYIVQGGNIYLVAKNSYIPQGRFDLINGYRTLEFSSTMECGKNACGRNIFCLPVCRKNPSGCSVVAKEKKNGKTINIKGDIYNMLLKTASTISSSSFEAVPFSGFMDVSGNALDGNRDGKVTDANKIANKKIFPISQNYDNYYWQFTVKDSIDLTAPYITKVSPGIDTQSVVKNEKVKIRFSKRMRYNSLYTIKIKESPTTSLKSYIPMWYLIEDIDGSAKGTTTTIAHGDFFIDTEYYPILTSDIEDANYNCLYPAQGPLINNGSGRESVICDGKSVVNCSNAKKSPKNDLFCNGKLQSTYSNHTATTCVNGLIKEMGKTP